MTTIVFNTLEIDSGSWRDFVKGMAEAFNLRGSAQRHYYFHPSAEQADLAAIQNDWETVGRDLSRAVSTVAR